MIDIARARLETPGCNHVVHFNNAGSALPPDCVVEAVKAHLDLEARMGGYEAAAAAHERIEGTYQAIAELIGSAPEEIALVENATRAWDMAFYSMRFRAGDRILTGRAEYASNVIAFLQAARRTGAHVEVVPDDETGQVDVEALARMLDERVKLIAITHVPTNGGLVNPAGEIGRICRSANIPFLLDACQSVGQMKTDVADLQCDILSATGRKFLRAPRGTGFLYVRKSMIEQLEPVMLDLHAAQWVDPDRYEIRKDARRFENWESGVAARIGLGVAVRYALGWGLQAIEVRVEQLAAVLRARLEMLPNVRVRDKGARRCAIVSFSLDGESPGSVEKRLRGENINVSVSEASSTLFDMKERGLSSLIRASVHYYNTEGEIDRLIQALER
jgi:cysteine desulfurase/selenocysteine lyase